MIMMHQTKKCCLIACREEKVKAGRCDCANACTNMMLKESENNAGQSKPTYEELVIALKETHNLYLEAVKVNYMTHDITRVMSNDQIFKRLE